MSVRTWHELGQQPSGQVHVARLLLPIRTWESLQGGVFAPRLGVHIPCSVLILSLSLLRHQTLAVDCSVLDDG